MAAPVIQASFAAGELAPSIYGRVDLTKYHSGVALMRNFFVDFKGGAVNRSGTLFVGQAINSAKQNRLIPFSFNTLQTYALVFGDTTLRVIMNGGWVLEPTTAISAINLATGTVTDVANGYSNGDEIYITGLLGTTQLNGRNFKVANVAANTYTLVDLYGVAVNMASYTAYVAGGTAARIYTLVTPYAGADLALLKYTQSADTMTLTHGTGLYAPYQLTRTGHAAWTLVASTFAPSTVAPTIGALVVSSAGTTTYNYVVTTLSANGAKESVASGIATTALSAAMSAAAGAHITVQWAAGAQPAGTVISGYKIYRTAEINGAAPSAGASFGYVGTVSAAAVAFTDANITPDFTQSPPQAFNPFTSNNPFCSTYFQGRQIYGGTQNSVAQLNFSRSSDFQNMDYSSPSRANDSITVTLTSQQVNAIKFLVPMISLVVMTGSSAWAVDDGTSLGVITPTSIVANPQVYTGCADVPPLIIEHDILYVQAKGSVVRDLVYNFYVRVYTGADMSVMANHLFFGHQITEWCWAMEPHRVVWCIRDDGLMLSFTYLKDQEIYAWARHDTSGLYKSICTISEGQEDAVYVIVSRLVNGQYLQYIERVQSRNLGGDPSIGIPGDVEKSWFVDAGLQYTQPTFTQSLTPSALTGSITLTAGTAVFTLVTDIGKVIRVNGGIMTVTAVTSTTVVLATTTRNLTSLWPSTSWTMTLPVSAVSGLNHLEGSTVSILADGNVQASQVVTSGAITLQQAASAIVVGLPYQAQIKTLAIDVNTEPTLQGRRKKVPAVTLRVLNTRGLKVGPTFTKLVEIKERNIQPMGQPVQLITSDERVLTASDYDVQGIVCIQQDYPLPATITAIIPELTAGDS